MAKPPAPQYAYAEISRERDGRHIQAWSDRGHSMWYRVPADADVAISVPLDLLAAVAVDQPNMAAVLESVVRDGHGLIINNTIIPDSPQALFAAIMARRMSLGLPTATKAPAPRL